VTDNLVVTTMPSHNSWTGKPNSSLCSTITSFKTKKCI